MALSKQLTHPATKASGGYVALVSYRWDRAARECVARFGLYKDAAHAAEPGAIPCAIAGKLRLEGEAFDKWVGKAADADIRKQLYLAAKAEPLISDFGEPDPKARGFRRPFDGAADV